MIDPWAKGDLLDRVPGCTVDLMSETRNELRDRTVVTRISKVLDAQLVTRTDSARIIAHLDDTRLAHYTIEKLKLPGGQLRNFRVYSFFLRSIIRVI